MQRRRRRRRSNRDSYEKIHWYKLRIYNCSIVIVAAAAASNGRCCRARS
jgi:hypothetical protein